MSELPNFHQEFIEFIQEEARKEVNSMRKNDISRADLTQQNIRNFSYNTELEKFEKSNPLLLAAIIGSISKGRIQKQKLLFQIALKLLPVLTSYQNY